MELVNADVEHFTSQHKRILQDEKLSEIDVNKNQQTLIRILKVKKKYKYQEKRILFKVINEREKEGKCNTYLEGLMEILGAGIRKEA